MILILFKSFSDVKALFTELNIFFRYMWWGLFNLRPHLSEEDELKEKKNQLIREIKEKKLRIKKLKQARKEQRAERFR